jgi:hypothetical protein
MQVAHPGSPSRSELKRDCECPSRGAAIPQNHTRKLTVRATDQQARERAEATFKRRQAQLREAPEALAEYQAKSRAVRDRTTRLRALRLAREAADGSDCGKSNKNVAGAE